jgi:predicted transcriptional regulator
MPADEKSIRTDLQQLRDQIAATKRELDALRKRRDTAVVKAAKLGMTHREIAKASGMTHQRVTQILNRD